MVHNRFKNIQCEFCPKTFTSNLTLKRHVKLKHVAGKLMYQCDICDTTFICVANLKSHFRTIHDREEKLTKDLKIPPHT